MVAHIARLLMMASAAMASAAMASAVDYEAESMGVINAKYNLGQRSEESYKADVFDPLRFEPGSSLEMARELTFKVFTPSEAIMNDEVRAFRISDPELTFQRTPEGPYVRKVFAGVDLDDKELAFLSAFKQWMHTQGKSLPRGYLDQHNFALRYKLPYELDNFEKTYE